MSDPVFRLSCSVSESRSATLVALAGRLDAQNIPVIEMTFTDIGDRTVPQIVLDLGGLSWIDSAGVGQISKLIKRSRRTGGKVVLACMTGQPRKIFELLCLDTVVDLFETVEEALAALPTLQMR